MNDLQNLYAKQTRSLIKNVPRWLLSRGVMIYGIAAISLWYVFIALKFPVITEFEAKIDRYVPVKPLSMEIKMPSDSAFVARFIIEKKLMPKLTSKSHIELTLIGYPKGTDNIMNGSFCGFEKLDNKSEVITVVVKIEESNLNIRLNHGMIGIVKVEMGEMSIFEQFLFGNKKINYV